MGCGTSKSSDSVSLGNRLARVRKRRSGTLEEPCFVRELFDEDIHEVYDFTGPVLGSGAFATVLRVRDRMSGVEYAIKQVDLTGVKDDPSTMRMLYNEIKGMKMLSHPNIVRLQEVYEPKDEEMLYMVLDRLEGGSVDALRKQEGHIEEDHAGYIMAQVVDAVRYCHDLKIMHRDLKLANCMFEDNSPAPIVKVIDFGLCAELKDGQTSSAFVGTMTYAAPEVIMKNKCHGIECDMWSIGIMTYLLIGGRFPFYADDGGALGHQIKFMAHSYKDEVWKGVSALCRDFIDKCLNKNPKTRITAKQAQHHPWVKKAAKAMEGAPLSKGAMMSMMKFQDTNLFERIAMELVAYSYEPSQIKDLERHFREMDTDGTGLISLVEFKAALMERRRSIVQRQQEEADAKRASADPPTALVNAFRLERPGEGGGKPKELEAGQGLENAHGDEGQKVARRGQEGVLEGRAAAAERSTEGARPASTAEREAAGARAGKGEPGRKTLGASASADRPSVTMGEVGRIVRRLSSREGLGGCSTSDHTSLSHSSPSSNATPGLIWSASGKKASSGSVADARSMFGGLDEDGVERIFEAIDVDGSGNISITEFVAACLVKRQINDTAIKAAFHRLDYTMSGLISAEDVKMYLGASIDESKLEAHMNEISSRTDGLVTLEDFTKCLKRHVLRSRFSSRGGSLRSTGDSFGRPRTTTDSDIVRNSTIPGNGDRPKDVVQPGAGDRPEPTEKSQPGDNNPGPTEQPKPADQPTASDFGVEA